MVLPYLSSRGGHASPLKDSVPFRSCLAWEPPVGTGKTPARGTIPGPCDPVLMALVLTLMLQQARCVHLCSGMGEGLCLARQAYYYFCTSVHATSTWSGVGGAVSASANSMCSSIFFCQFILFSFSLLIDTTWTKNEKKKHKLTFDPLFFLDFSIFLPFLSMSSFFLLFYLFIVIFSFFDVEFSKMSLVTNQRSCVLIDCMGFHVYLLLYFSLFVVDAEICIWPQTAFQMKIKKKIFCKPNFFSLSVRLSDEGGTVLERLCEQSCFLSLWNWAVSTRALSHGHFLPLSTWHCHCHFFERIRHSQGTLLSFLQLFKVKLIGLYQAY